MSTVLGLKYLWAVSSLKGGQKRIVGSFDPTKAGRNRSRPKTLSRGSQGGS